MNHNDYNGWTNYETWNVKLWVDNEEPSYRYWNNETQRIVKRALDTDQAKRELADQLKSEHEDAMPVLTGTFADLLGAALSEVNWYEIAESMVDDYAAENPIEERAS